MQPDAIRLVTEANFPGITVKPGDDIGSALAKGATAGVDVLFRPGTYIIPTGGWTWEATRHSLVAAGNVIWDASALTSGYALTVRGNDGRDYLVHDFQQVTHRLQGMHIKGPTADATTADGILIQDVGTSSRGNSHVNLENVKITGFRTQTWLGDNTWCIRWVNCFYNGAKQYGVYCDSGLNAGENYTWIGGTIAGVKNAAKTGVGFFISDTGNSDAYFFGTSFDYNDCALYQKSGGVLWSGVHCEDNSDYSPMVKLSYTPGLERPIFVMNGGVLAPTEKNTLRPSLIDVLSGNAVYVNLFGVKFGVWEKQLTVIRNLGGSTPNNQIVGGDLQTGGNGLQSLPGDYANRLYNAGFDTGNTTGWSAGGIVTYSAQTTTKNSGTHALKMNSVGTVGSSFFAQTVDVKPGDNVFVSAAMSADTLTGGNVLLSLRFYAADGTTIISSYNIGNVVANQGWTTYRNRYTAPAGTRTAQFRFIPTDLNGNVYADDCYLATI